MSCTASSGGAELVEPVKATAPMPQNSHCSIEGVLGVFLVMLALSLQGCMCGLFGGQAQDCQGFKIKNGRVLETPFNSIANVVCDSGYAYYGDDMQCIWVNNSCHQVNSRVMCTMDFALGKPGTGLLNAPPRSGSRWDKAKADGDADRDKNDVDKQQQQQRRLGGPPAPGMVSRNPVPVERSTLECKKRLPFGTATPAPTPKPDAKPSPSPSPSPSSGRSGAGAPDNSTDTAGGSEPTPQIDAATAVAVAEAEAEATDAGGDTSAAQDKTVATAAVQEKFDAGALSPLSEGSAAKVTSSANLLGTTWLSAATLALTLGGVVAYAAHAHARRSPDELGLVHAAE
eukprot:gnl/TRDRNA2_/TRDRNA2_136000_c0_seq1.p1 gnl/TRDRNA2_/TRDRNA2_136000_c0~~gnl/TRDRNA2_/TRDRNA2_136000_c0_seq1.p1  ORF type:complete len:387 (-),score=61.30 gnl/TRDRNA2_/TRDRNA2_136000_c0_seq1:33-1061(-)